MVYLEDAGEGRGVGHEVPVVFRVCDVESLGKEVYGGFQGFFECAGCGSHGGEGAGYVFLPALAEEVHDGLFRCHFPEGGFGFYFPEGGLECAAGFLPDGGLPEGFFPRHPVLEGCDGGFYLGGVSVAGVCKGSGDGRGLPPVCFFEQGDGVDAGGEG